MWGWPRDAAARPPASFAWEASLLAESARLKNRADGDAWQPQGERVEEEVERRESEKAHRCCLLVRGSKNRISGPRPCLRSAAWLEAIARFTCPSPSSSFWVGGTGCSSRCSDASRSRWLCTEMRLHWGYAGSSRPSGWCRRGLGSVPLIPAVRSRLDPYCNLGFSSVSKEFSRKVSGAGKGDQKRRMLTAARKKV